MEIINNKLTKCYSLNYDVKNKSQNVLSAYDFQMYFVNVFLLKYMYVNIQCMLYSLYNNLINWYNKNECTF